MAYIRHPDEDIYKADISRVTTVTGASKIAFVHPDTIYKHVIAGNIYAELEGNIWLVSIASVKAYYGLQETKEDE